jgi:cytochrome c-type biogenesis protein CcmH/NrfG
MKPKIICSDCSTVLTRTDRFCPSCGASVEWEAEAAAPSEPPADRPAESPGPAPQRVLCDVCGYGNEAGSQYCESCGARLVGTAAPVTVQKQEGERNAAQSPAESRPEGRQPATIASGKVISIAAAILLVVFALYIFVIDRDTPHQHEQPLTGGMSGGQMERAIAQEIERLEHDLRDHEPENEQTMLRLANLYHDVRRFDEAIKYYRMYVDRDPNNPDVLVDLGICYFEAGESDQAVATVERVVSAFPGHQLAAFNLGIIYLNLGEVGSANRYFERAYEIDPDNETGQRARRIIQEHSF